MPENRGASAQSGILQSKRDATRYQILVEIAERQPAVSQQEVADSIGITAQAVSDYLQGLVDDSYVEKHGRGRYEVTKEGVDWLITRTEELDAYLSHVSEDVVGGVEIETALATGDVEAGQRVSLSMRDGVLRATPGDVGSATAVAVTDADVNEDVGVTDFDGVVDYELGQVTILSVPQVRDGGSREADAGSIAERAAATDLVAVAGTEARAAVRRADVTPDLRFGTQEGVREAAMRGLDVFLLATNANLSPHTDALRDQGISYEVVDAGE